MFRALYDYRTDLKRYLSFQTGDQFTVIDSSNNDWFLAQNGFGEIGYIPKNYVVKDEGGESDVLRSIDRAIEVIHYDAGSHGGQYTHVQRENLKKLIEHRENVVESYQTHRAPVAANDQAVTNEGVKQKRPSARRTAPAPPTGGQSETRDTINTNSSALKATSNSDTKVDVTSIHTNSISKTSQNNESITNNSQIESTDYDTDAHITQGNSTTGDVNDAHIAHENQVHSTIVASNSDTVDRVTVDSSMVTTNGSTASAIVTKDCASSPFPSPLKSRNTKTVSSVIDCRTVSIPDNVGSDLVEEVRKNTGLSYKKSCIAVETVLGHLGMSIPDVSELMDRVFKTIQVDETGTEEDTNGEGATSSDYDRLCELFAQLTECKDDSQQRGWALHEDEQIITDSLEELLSILENAKQSVSRRALAVDSYEGVYNLVQYYQMENRVKLRLLLLRVFGAMCTLDSTVITMLLCSVLTTELAKELHSAIDDVQRSSYISLLLSMIFSMGEPVPANLHEHLNAAFVGFVFESIENAPSVDYEDQVTDILVNFILAFNLHFRDPKGNLVLKVIEEKKTVKVFTEKILLLFNRGEDPVRIFEHEPQPANSVMKMLQDMYSQRETSFILYTNDAKVLIDIVLRHLTDLSPGDQERTAHLKLMQLYLQNADYPEHRHRHDQLSECLHRIEAEEEETGDDKHIAKYIFTQLNVLD